MKVSNCCGAKPYGETDLCSKCKEHADFEDDGKTLDDIIFNHFNDKYPDEMGELIDSLT